MSSDRKKPGVAFWATVIVAGTAMLALGGYIVAYAYMVEGEWVFMAPDGPYVQEEYRNPISGRLEEKNWSKIFAPVHWIDRQVRRDRWSPE
jgi:hypothetical protein